MAQSNPSSARALFQNNPSAGRTNRGTLFPGGGRGGRSRGALQMAPGQNLGPTVMTPQPDSDTPGSSPQGKSGLTRAWTGARNGDGSPNLTNASKAVQGVAARAQNDVANSSTYAGDRNSPALAGNIAAGKITPNAGMMQPGSPQTMTPPPPTATTDAAQETESANPLTGTSNDLPMGKTQTLPSSTPATDINHGRAMGFSSKGQATPAGQDITTPGATPDADAAMNGNPGSTPDTQTFSGGMGAYQRSFSSPTSAAIYHDYVKKIFGSAPPQQPGQTPSMLARTPGPQVDED